MARFSERIKEAADNAERMNRALQSLPSGGSFAGDPGGGSGSGGSPQIIFTTNITSNTPPNRTGVRTMNDAPNRFGQVIAGSSRSEDELARALAYFGLSGANKSEAFLKQILEEFRRITRNAVGGLTVRTGASG